jgi:hypothetical protein
MMKAVATLDPERARILGDFLAAQGIAYETHNSTDENGIENTELLVQDDRYDAACAATETWEAEMTARSENMSRRRCPTCNSPHTEFAEDFPYEKSAMGITAAYKCKDCGRIFVPRR